MNARDALNLIIMKMYCVQVLVTSRELPMQLPSHFTKLANIPLPTSYNDYGEGFVYVKSDLTQVHWVGMGRGLA